MGEHQLRGGRLAECHDDPDDHSHRQGQARHLHDDGAQRRDVTVEESDWMARRFEENRGHLRGVAYRMLGSLSEAEDAVHEAWLRFSRADTSAVENLGGWLTTVVARVCLDMLRSRKSRRREALAADVTETIANRAA